MELTQTSNNQIDYSQEAEAIALQVPALHNALTNLANLVFLPLPFQYHMNQVDTLAQRICAADGHFNTIGLPHGICPLAFSAAIDDIRTQTNILADIYDAYMRQSCP